MNRKAILRYALALSALFITSNNMRAYTSFNVTCPDGRVVSSYILLNASNFKDTNEYMRALREKAQQICGCSDCNILLITEIKTNLEGNPDPGPGPETPPQE